MNDAVKRMLDAYHCQSLDQRLNALREILQALALLGLWRGKFFERAAFYGGAALRLLHGLDRFSEDMDFSLLAPDPGFSLKPYGDALRRELGAFGFEVEFAAKEKTRPGAIESAFIKANTVRQLLLVGVDPGELLGIHHGQTLKIKLEVDVDPPGGFNTESRYLFSPIPHAVRVYSLPDLFAGKLHAVLCRKWQSSQKGRDWYDLAWYAGRHPQVNLRHLESRMRQSGNYTASEPLSIESLRDLLREAVERLDVDKVRSDVQAFVLDSRVLELWSRDFFLQAAAQVTPA